jgi:class 3 adenylate cyclase
MTDIPVTKYVMSTDGTKLAYQVIGDGPIDVLVQTGLGTPLDLMWDEPSLTRFGRRLGSFSRTIWFDPRGMGASEGTRLGLGLNDVTVGDNDQIAVLEALGCERAVLLGAGFAGMGAIHFAALHPDRVDALVLVNSFSHYVQGSDYPWGYTTAVLQRIATIMKENWGTAAGLEVLAPSRAADERFRAWYAKGERLGGGPDQTAQAFRTMCERDLRPLLASIHAPTLVLHREGNRLFQMGAGQYLAEHIPGAKFVALSGDDHLIFVGDTDALLDEIEEFLTGAHQAPEGDLTLAAILFTDIASSTEQAARLGHRKWSALTDEHDAMVRAVLNNHRGREIKTMGDGFLATFDATSRALRAAKEIVTQAKAMGIEVRAGVHSGEVEIRPDDISGLAVAIAKRISDLADPGEVLVSMAVPPLLAGSAFDFVDRGEHELKGVPGTWRLFAVDG